MTFTNDEIMEISIKLKALEESKEKLRVEQLVARHKIASDWLDSVKLTTPKNREEALSTYKKIKSMLDKEKDRDRRTALGRKLREMNEKFIEFKKAG